MAAYIPAVQKFAIQKAASMVADRTGYRLTVDRFRVRFPLGISLRGATVATPAGDTIAEVGRAQVHAALLPLLKGRVLLSDIAFENTRATYVDTVSGMVLRARIDALRAASASLDPAGKSVKLGRTVLDGGDAYFSTGNSGNSAPSADTLPFDWNIDVGRFELRDIAFAMDMADDPAVKPTAFDYNHIRTSGVGVSVRNFKFSGNDISTRFDGLTFAERSGLTVTDGNGGFVMNESGLSLTDFTILTSGSQIKGSAKAGSGIMDADPATPVKAQLSASVSIREINLFAPLPEQLRHVLTGKSVIMEGDVGGTLDDLSIDDLTVAISSNLSVKVGGTLRSLMKPEALSGSVTLEGELSDLDFTRGLVADTAMRHRIAIPHDMSLRASADFSPENYNVKSFALRADTGRMVGRGRFFPDRQAYFANIRIVDFPLDRFLPHDSLGMVDGTLSVRGRGYDPATLEADIDMAIDRFDYKTIDLGHLTAYITASKGDMEGRITSRNDLLATNVSLKANLWRDTLRPPAGRPLPDIHAPAPPLGYLVDARIDSIVVRFGGDRHKIVPVVLHASASSAGTEVTLVSGDLSVDVSSPLAPDSLIRSAGRTESEIRRQLASRRFSPDTLQSAFPYMTLKAHAGRGNFLREFARLKGLDFRTVSADVSTEEGHPFHLDVVAVGVVAGLEVDTLALHAVRNDNRLDYQLRLANRPGNVADLGLIGVTGNAGGRAVTANVLQRNPQGATGFDFGIRASLEAGDAIRAEIEPDPVLGYELWVVGADGDDTDRSADDSKGNWVEYSADGIITADLHLSSATDGASKELSASDVMMLGSPWGLSSSTAVLAPPRHISLTSASLPRMPRGALRLQTYGLDIKSMLDLFPTAPPIGGLFSSDVTFGFVSHETRGNITAVRGSVGAKNFSYNLRRVADIDASIGFVSGDSGRMLLNTSVQIDKTVALAAKGTYAAGTIDFNVDIPGVPLSIVEGFLPPGTANLTGRLDGKVHIAGDTSRPILEGDLGFTGAKAEVLMTGTTFGVSPERIVIADNRVTFNNFGLIAPNDRRLAVNGGVGIADLSAPRADLAIRARNFRFVDSQHIGGSQVYGTGSLDANITARGALSAVSVRGDIDLSEETDIVYILRDEGQKVRDEKQHIVQFVPFADSLPEDEELVLPPMRRVGFDMLLGVDIGEGLRATLSLDELNENRVELVGGGALSLSMNPQGDTRMTGRYTLSGGTLHYKPPMIPQKIFAVSDGSHVEWTGPLATPRFHVSAAQTMDVALDFADGDSREVEFEISVAVSGSLSAIDMTFDAAAPGDIMIQNELLAMSDEGRMQQALTLLVYNQYTGPSASSRGMSFDARSQINDFISKEVNQWARNNLKGVDFSMGIDTRDAATGGSYTDYSYSVSKSLFSDRVKISIGGKVSDEAGASAGFADNLLEDVALEYRLTRRDNMFLKLYRYNTRESILEGEVTETGGGFIIRKKMNRPKDIFRRAGPRRDRTERRSDSLYLGGARTDSPNPYGVRRRPAITAVPEADSIDSPEREIIGVPPEPGTKKGE